MRSRFIPVLEEGGVDVVLTAHSHTYERSRLFDGVYGSFKGKTNFILDAGDGDPENDGAYVKRPGSNPHGGTVQVVAGHAGGEIGRVGTLSVMCRSLLEYGSFILEIRPEWLTGTMINRAGKIRDRFQIRKIPKES